MSHNVSLNLVTKTEKGWLTAFNLLSTFSMGIAEMVEFSQISVSSVELGLSDESEDLEEVEEFHDENTMKKVYDAFKVHGFNDDEATEIINTLQNSGILFREIRK